ncbi:40S ribosomal protein S6-like [Culex quinquefasciatus]|uniref:40S ribosomal protein S6-like n=1 Tax=Culex quinquefasciatus TaxID=7176 RepID=UPI0018E35535|nr:40S ribosomal protein S6-like [Culex quinquefasciatus]
MLREGQKIRGLTDTTMPRRLGPKPATNIRKLYNLAKFVVKYPLPEEDGKKAKSKRPKSSVLSRWWCFKARDIVWSRRSVASRPST